LNISYGVKASEISIMKQVENAMEEMIRFEIQDKAKMKKTFEFREYLFEFLLNQYGLRNIAQKNYDIIIHVRYIQN
jgi:hypothetical protein